MAWPIRPRSATDTAECPPQAAKLPRRLGAPRCRVQPLPRTEERAGARRSCGARPRRAGGVRGGPGALDPMISVLLVEDHAAFQEALTMALRSEGDFEVLAAVGRGDQAGAAAATQPTLAIVDIALPDGSGADALADIRRRPLPLAVVVLSGAAEDAEFGRCVAAGASAVVGKSSDLAEVVAVLRRVAGGRPSCRPRTRLGGWRRWERTRTATGRLGCCATPSPRGSWPCLTSSLAVAPPHRSRSA